MSVNYYDGSSLVEVPGTSTSPEKLGFGYATCTTAEATTVKVATLTNYVLKKNSYVSVKFTNNVPAASTLNINSKGAKAIYRNGAAIKNKVIMAGDMATFLYDGTNYNLVAIDTCGKAFKVVLSSVSSLPQTYPTSGTDLRIKDDMVCVHSELTNPSAQTSDWTVTTTNGTVTVSGSINGPTDITLYLIKTEEV